MSIPLPNPSLCGPNTMIVYRAERIDKPLGAEYSGAFGSGGAAAYSWATKYESNPYDMPCPFSPAESGTELQRHHESRCGELGPMLFGFADMSQLRAVFGDVVGRRAMLTEKKVGIRVYAVPTASVMRGNSQCIFHPRRAELIGTLDTETLDFVPAGTGQEVAA